MMARKKNDSNFEKKIPLITFGIPCYNAEKTIGNLLNCFYISDYFKYEIIILDDGSDDKTSKICKDFLGRTDLDIRIIRMASNKGVSFARNEIIKRANGDWLTFIDSDDFVFFCKYEREIRRLLNTDYDFVIAPVIGRIGFKKPSISQLISREIINSPCAKFYKVKKLKTKKLLFILDIDLGEDLVFNLNYLSECDNYNILRSHLYRYNKKFSLLTKKDRSDKYKLLMELNNNCCILMKKYYGGDKKILKALEYIRIKNCISCMTTYNGKNATDFLKKMKCDNPKKYLYLNSIKETIIYYLWYMLPNAITVHFLLSRKN